MVTDDCHACGVCLEVCPRGAIRIEDSGGRPKAGITPASCDLCLACLEVCPVEAIKEPYPPEWRE